MPVESSATSVVAALSVAVAAVGHALVGGSAVPFGVVPPFAALAGVCWLLGEYLAGERFLTALVLAGVQLFVHVTLDATHPPMHHGMAMPSGIGGSLMMTAAHLSVLLAGVLAITGAHRWVYRILRILARFLPQLPVLPAVRRTSSARVAHTPAPRLVGAWLTSNVCLRGPPVIRVIPAR
ncbi:hypothetical protein AB0E63_17990 [Kribbella sp. NPDC026596]|uniref:hypothetical protein n=1 Tax=Kribbella sp. NPDC026596 TaxID=3155122 RepID=UPI0033F02930